MRAITRVGASICLSVFSLVSIILLLPSSRVSTQLQKIALGTTLDDFPTLWNWGKGAEDSDGEGVRLVVFGDSWVDDSGDGVKGKGKSWAEILCEEVSRSIVFAKALRVLTRRQINCTSHLNFAASQLIESYPSSAPTGAITSNAIYVSSIANAQNPPLETLAAELLPDLSAQIQKFIAMPPPSTKPKETLFVVSFGFWDIYSFAGMDFGLGMNVTDRTVEALFDQLNILYAHYSENLSAAHKTPESTDSLNATEVEEPPHRTPPFRVIIPKLFDPTLLPGWLSQRPVPLKPSSIAENQKNAVYLASRWNTLVENKIGGWLKEPALPPANMANTTTETLASLPEVEKDVFYYDLAQYLLDIIVEHQLEDEGLSDASGLGNGDSPFEDVYEPCVREAGDGAEDGFVDLNGQLVCKEPEEYLFWDSFSLGSVAKEGIGKEVGKMVIQGKSMKEIWKQKEGH